MTDFDVLNLLETQVHNNLSLGELHRDISEEF